MSGSRDACTRNVIVWYLWSLVTEKLASSDFFCLCPASPLGSACNSSFVLYVESKYENLAQKQKPERGALVSGNYSLNSDFQNFELCFLQKAELYSKYCEYFVVSLVGVWSSRPFHQSKSIRGLSGAPPPARKVKVDMRGLAAGLPLLCDWRCLWLPFTLY